MTYVALLRGINVGGKNKVAMSRLKKTFEAVGLTDVNTYINSGNVIFKASKRKPATIVSALEKAIEQDFGFPIKVLVRDLPALRKVIEALPDTWTNDQTMKCDVMFLWEDFDRKGVVDDLKIKPEIEDLVYVPGALIWRVDRPAVTRSGMMRMVGTGLYQAMTIRNVNTVRRLAELMASI